MTMTPKTLADRLKEHPELEKRLSALLDITEAPSGEYEKPHEAEDAIIEHFHHMGNEFLAAWGNGKAQQKLSEAVRTQSVDVVRKKTFIG